MFAAAGLKVVTAPTKARFRRLPSTFFVFDSRFKVLKIAIAFFWGSSGNVTGIRRCCRFKPESATWIITIRREELRAAGNLSSVVLGANLVDSQRQKFISCHWGKADRLFNYRPVYSCHYNHVNMSRRGDLSHSGSLRLPACRFGADWMVWTSRWLERLGGLLKVSSW